MYLRARVVDIRLRDFRCVDASNILAALASERNLSRLTLRHVKALLSALLTFARQQGVLDTPNPIRDALIPRAARCSNGTHATTPDEVLAMLNALSGTARMAVALMYFAALRPSEAVALKWEHFDGKTLRVPGTKTVASAATISLPEIQRTFWPKHGETPDTSCRRQLVNKWTCTTSLIEL